MKRRDFIALAGSAAAAWPLAARAQQAERVRRIGVLIRASGDRSRRPGARQSIPRGAGEARVGRRSQSADRLSLARRRPLSLEHLCTGTCSTGARRDHGQRHPDRREFFTLIGGAAAAWPLGAQAQQSARLIGYIRDFIEFDRAEICGVFRTERKRSM